MFALIISRLPVGDKVNCIFSNPVGLFQEVCMQNKREKSGCLLYLSNINYFSIILNAL